MIYVFFRITAFFLAAGIIFPNGTPKLFKICFSLLLSAMIAINLDINVTIKNFYELIIYGTMETINGLVLGYMVSICFYIIKMVGKLIDGQMGLSMASTYDPNTQSQATLMENLIYFVGLVVFFSIDAHHIVINSMQNSFKIIPVGYSIIDFKHIYSIFYNGVKNGNASYSSFNCNRYNNWDNIKKYFWIKCYDYRSSIKNTCWDYIFINSITFYIKWNEGYD